MIFASTRRQRGVSLIEALVALAVMSIGMLGLVSLQTSLRGTSDVAKQRSEAVRLAQKEIEGWRAFMVMDATNGVAAYADLEAGTTTATVTGANATFTRENIVTELDEPRRGKALTVNVSWTDRNNETHNVRLATTVAGIAPELAATMTVPGDGDQLRQPLGRKRGIPLQAKELGGGNSGYMPPGSPGVAWIFNNITGLITVCTTTAVTTGDLIYDDDTATTDNVTCGTSKAILLSGFVRYAVTTIAPTAADAKNPATTPPNPAPLPTVTFTNTPGGSVTCARENGTSGSPYTAYYCAVPVFVIPNVTPTWTGSLKFSGLPFPAAGPTNATNDSPSNRRVCRYFELADDTATTTVNEGDGIYSMVSEPQMNQNYLVIAAGDGSGVPGSVFACPSLTVAHQSAL